MKPTYDGKFLGVKLGKGKTGLSDQNIVVSGKEQGVHYVVTIDPVRKTGKVWSLNVFIYIFFFVTQKQMESLQMDMNKMALGAQPGSSRTILEALGYD